MSESVYGVLGLLVVVSICIAIYAVIIRPIRRSLRRCFVCHQRVGRKNWVIDRSAKRNDMYHLNCYNVVHKGSGGEIATDQV